MKSGIVALLAALLIAPTAALGQSADTRTDAQTTMRTPQARIDAALDMAAQAGVPAELIESKVAEGRAKNIAEERIAAAVETRMAALIRASETLSNAGIHARTAGDLAVTADALDAGVSQQAVVRVSRNATAERRAVAVAVLADLVRLGHPLDTALGRVTAALSSSASLASLHAEVASQLRLGGMRPTLDAAGTVRIR